MKLKSFTFNQFYENTFIVSDSTNDCIIIDPGCYSNDEKNILKKYIEDNNLNPVKLINTHCHIDHILGNKFVATTWDLNLETHQNDIELLENSAEIARLYGFIDYEKSPFTSQFLNEGDIVEFGNSKLKILYTPGHAPGHISLYSKEEKFIISGDVLFKSSIGRTDLPGGDFNVLIESIKTKILCLDDDTVVYCGHGPATTVGYERVNNPFLK
jgi:glyoxylase-like metal-dependent hydrolase (beta-lactamase superfamily II)